MSASLDTRLLVRVIAPGLLEQWIRNVPAPCCVLSLYRRYLTDADRWPGAREFAEAGPASLLERQIRLVPEMILPKVGRGSIVAWISLMVNGGGELLAEAPRDTYPDLDIDFESSQYVIRHPGAYWLAAYSARRRYDLGGYWRVTCLRTGYSPFAQPRSWHGDGRTSLSDRFVGWARTNMARQGISLAGLVATLPSWCTHVGRHRIQEMLRRHGGTTALLRPIDIEAVAWALGFEVDLVLRPRAGKDLEDDRGAEAGPAHHVDG